MLEISAVAKCTLYGRGLTPKVKLFALSSAIQVTTTRASPFRHSCTEEPDITMYQGTDKIASLYRGIVLNESPV